MSLAFAIAIYFVCWWLVLFTILPIGVKTQSEAGHVEPGTPESAPSAPHLVIKLLVTTVVTTVIFAAIYWAMVDENISFSGIPFLPQFEDLSSPAP